MAPPRLQGLLLVALYATQSGRSDAVAPGVVPTWAFWLSSSPARGSRPGSRSTHERDHRRRDRERRLTRSRRRRRRARAVRHGTSLRGRRRSPSDGVVYAYLLDRPPARIRLATRERCVSVRASAGARSAQLSPPPDDSRGHRFAARCARPVGSAHRQRRTGRMRRIETVALRPRRRCIARAVAPTCRRTVRLARPWRVAASSSTRP